MAIHLLILNFNRKNDTIHCVGSVIKSLFTDFYIHVLDNGSYPPQFAELKEFFKDNEKVNIYLSEKNLGFAGGNNFLMEKIIPGAGSDDLVLFLNNDTEIEPYLLENMAKAVDRSEKKEMVAARMMRMNDKSKIDNLGLSVYLSCTAMNRTNLNDVLFGPSGGCALYTVNCLREVHEKTGCYFDPHYFCYAEDMDLAWRALWLGFRPAYADDAVCYHKGGATTGGNFNLFIRYHTLRNTLATLVKNMPLSLMFRYGVWIVLFQTAMFFRCLFPLHFLTVFKAYGSFLMSLPRLLRQRKIILKSRTLDNKTLLGYFTRRAYDWRYLRGLLRRS